jgi:hypothetical protein
MLNQPAEVLNKENVVLLSIHAISPHVYFRREVFY